MLMTTKIKRQWYPVAPGTRSLTLLADGAASRFCVQLLTLTLRSVLGRMKPQADPVRRSASR